MDQFFNLFNNDGHAPQEVTKSAFFQARTQLSYTAFIELNHVATQEFYDRWTGYQRWHGLRLCAIDGSQIRLPNAPDIEKEFGVLRGKENQTDCPMALVSIYFDVLNQVAIDASINPTAASERACAARHLEHANPDDLVLYDRGYNAFWLYAHHRAHHLSFCMRAKINRGLPFKRFVESNKQQAVVTLHPNKRSIEQCAERGLPITPIRLRLIRVDLPGEVEVLITDLMDEAAYDVGQFKRLYHLRWGLEEHYKRLKQWVEIENFSGKSALSVKQDFHAKILSTNLTAFMVLAAQKNVDSKTQTHRHRYKVNFAQALSKMKHTVVKLIYRLTPDVSNLLKQIIDYVALTIEPIRSERSFKRKHSKHKKLHHPCYKRAL